MSNIKPSWEEAHPPMRGMDGDRAEKFTDLVLKRAERVAEKPPERPALTPEQAKAQAKKQRRKARNAKRAAKAERRKAWRAQRSASAAGLKIKKRAEGWTKELLERRGVEELRCEVCGSLLLTLTCRTCGTKAPSLR